jgi:hypothetical protein
MTWKARDMEGTFARVFRLSISASLMFTNKQRQMLAPRKMPAPLALLHKHAQMRPLSARSSAGRGCSEFRTFKGCSPPLHCYTNTRKCGRCQPDPVLACRAALCLWLTWQRSAVRANPSCDDAYLKIHHKREQTRSLPAASAVCRWRERLEATSCA